MNKKRIAQKSDARQHEVPRGMGLAMMAAGLILFIFYAVTLSPGVYPGASANWVGAALGLNAWGSAAHPLWRACTFLWRQVPVGDVAWRLNLSSAVYGAIAAALLCWYVARWVHFRIWPEAKRGEGRKYSLVAVLSGLVAALLFGTSLAGWSAATRFHPGCFQLMLLLVALLLHQEYLHSYKPRSLYGLAFFCGLGVAESTFFLVLTPYFIVSVLVSLYGHHRLRARLFLGLTVAGCLGAAMYLVSAWHFAHAASTQWGVPVDGSSALLDVFKLQIREVGVYVPKPGWPLILLLIAVPWVAFQTGYWQRLHQHRDYRADVLQFILIVLVMVLQFNVPISPWTQWAHMQHVPVFETALLAMLGGWAFAYWLLGSVIAWEPEAKALAVWKKKRQELIRFKKLLSLVICALLGVVLLGSAIGNGFRASGRRGAFADQCAQAILDQLGARSWVVTDGVLDTHIAARATALGRTVRVLNLTVERDEVQIRRLRQWVAEDPRLQPFRDRLLSAASLGVGPFVREWLAADPEASQALALYGVPDFWAEAGLTVCPERFLLLATRSPDGLRGRPFLDEHREFWKGMCRLLPRVKEEMDPIDTLRNLLRRHLSLVANDLGVQLIDLQRSKEAYDAFGEALVLDPDNLSAKLNQAELARAGVHPEAKEELDAAVKVAFSAFKRQPTVFEVVRFYGQIHSPKALASIAATWASLGQYGLARGAMERAAALTKDDTARSAIQSSLGGIRLSMNETVQGEADFRKLLKSEPNNPVALQGMLELALQRDDTADARAWLAKARAAGADATGLALVTARVEIAERNYDACYAHMVELTDREPQNLNAWSLLAVAMIYQGRVADAERLVLPKMEMIAGKLANAQVFQVRGAVARAKGPAFHAAARDAYRCALGLLPGRRDLLEVVLELDLALGDDAAAGSDANDLLRTDRENARAHFVLGTQAISRGDLAAAEWHLRKSVATDATAMAWNNLASLLRAKGSLDEAEQAARQAVAKASKSAAFLDTLADVLLEKGKASEAKEIVERARSLAPEDWQVAFTAARVLMKAGQPEEARILLRQVQGHLKSLPLSTQAEVARIANEWKSRR
jgi:tetratricopeptide (TPR) repeat protein